MICSEAQEYINKAIKEELNHVIKNRGSKFFNSHEAYAVIKEELEELDLELVNVKTFLECYWDNVKRDSNTVYKDSDIEEMLTHIKLLIEEAIQLSVVSQRAKDVY